MKKVRFGVVGVLGMGGGHCRSIVDDKNRNFELAAVADIVPEIARRRGEEYGVPHFTSAEEMYDSGRIDAVIIATPHYWHPPLAIKAARAGLHVLSDKPLGVTVGPVRQMIAECRKRKVVLGAMLQHRTRAMMVRMKRMVDAGQLGDIVRVSMICSTWYRTQAYYNMGNWRGTWDGEGGGILLNQAPHSLDIFQWIGGMPNRVTAVVGTRDHQIEVENTANFVCEYKNGATGYMYATTAEAPGKDEFLVAGDKGTLVAADGKLLFGKLTPTLRKHLMTCPAGFAKPEVTWSEVPLPKDPGGEHILIIRNFVDHLLKDKPLIAPGREAINELELSNAVYLSGFTRKPVALPVNDGQIDRLITRLEREFSTGRGGGLRAKARDGMNKLMRGSPRIAGGKRPITRCRH